MMKYKLLLAACLVLVSSCSYKEKIEQLNKQNSVLVQENNNLKKDNVKLHNDFKKIQEQSGQLNFLTKQLKDVKARLVTDYGDIELKFFPDKAPLHCFNFITRAESGYYNGIQFHRIIPGFMIQAGDPKSRDNKPEDDGAGGPLVNIPHEFNDTKHVPGILSMARQSNPALGAGSQFFIMHGTNSGLDGQYTAFGEVTKGMDVVNDIANARTYGKTKPALQNHPLKPIRIKRIEIFRYGSGK